MTIDDYGARELMRMAAAARVAELSARGGAGMTASTGRERRPTEAPPLRPWAMGDYDRFSQLVWEVGAMLVDAVDVGPGQRVLDVAAGTGNAAIRAAMAGAVVVASDLTPEHFVAGRRNARRAGVELEWVEADAQALPFDDGSFDVVLSCLGAIFAPDHQAVATELTRVARPGGTVGMVNFTPGGLGGAFFDLFAAFMPPRPEGQRSPTRWGEEPYVRDLFRTARAVQTSRRRYTERAPSVAAYCELVERAFGPAVALLAELDAPARASFHDALRRFVVEGNGGEGAVALEYEVLIVRVTR